MKRKKLRLHFNVSAQRQKRALNPPTNPKHIDTLHGKKIPDPFCPLEDIKAQATIDWVARQNKKFADFIAPASAAAQNTEQTLIKWLDVPERESMPSPCGAGYLFWRKKSGESRWSLYVKDRADYGVAGRLLLNPMNIDPSGKTNVTATTATRDGKTLAYQLSTSGSDATTLLFMDIATGQPIDLCYKNFRGSVSWDADGNGFHYERPCTDKEKSFEVAYHRMGADPAQDRLVFTPDATEMHVDFSRVYKDSKKTAGDYDWMSVSGTEPDQAALLFRKSGTQDSFTEIFPMKEGTLSPFQQIGDRIYATTSFHADLGQIVSLDPHDPGPEKWQTIITMDPKDELTSAFVWQHRIFATYMHDTGEVTRVHDLNGKYLHDMPIPALSTYSFGRFSIESAKALISIDNFQEDGGIYEYDIATNALQFVRHSPVPVDLKDCIVERAFAKSNDGTMVPMTIIRRPDVALDGTAATLMYGYGGFNVPLTPSFAVSIAEWVKSGGIYVQTNLRGGGEFGKDWYDNGRLDKKQNVFDDFCACAKYLVKNSYTSTKRLAINGGSNGGLLTLACAVQRPELFGAVISQVPVADMLRFHIGSYYGYGWKSDYGDMDCKRDFNIAARYSPLHNVPKNFDHPPILIVSDMHDDRVLPWHSFKMAATLQAFEKQGAQTFLHIKTDGGHGAGSTEKDWAQEQGVTRGFLQQTLGPIDQNAYKQMIAAQAKKAQGPQP